MDGGVERRGRWPGDGSCGIASGAACVALVARSSPRGGKISPRGRIIRSSGNIATIFGRRPRGSPHTRPSCQTFARTTRRARGSSSVSAPPSLYSRSSRSDGGRRYAGAATAHWTGGPGANDSRRKRRCGSPGHCSRRTVTSPTARRPTLPSSNSSWTEVPPRPRPHTATRPPRRTTKTTPSF